MHRKFTTVMLQFRYRRSFLENVIVKGNLILTGTLTKICHSQILQLKGIWIFQSLREKYLNLMGLR